jgi:quercetin dioxygenase-like cupin family protein
MKTPESWKSKAIELKSFINYSKASIVSKTLVDKKSGTLTLFALAKGQGLSEHTAPYDAVVQVLDGEAELAIGGKPVKAFPGEIVIMPANIPHAVRAIKKFKMLLTMIREK